MRRPEPRNKVRRVVPRVVREDDGDLPQRTRERLRGDRLLARHATRLLLDRAAHEHLGASAAKDDAGLFHGLGEDGERVVQGAFSLVDHLVSRAAENDGAGLAGCNTGELDELEGSLVRFGQAQEIAWRTLSSPIMISSINSQ